MSNSNDATIRKRGRPNVARFGPHPVDIHVGGRVRIQRLLKGFSQEKLAEMTSVSFQQMQKYETGANRVSASRLYEISRALDVPIGYFFEGIGEDPDHDGMASERSGSTMSNSDKKDLEVMARRETLQLVRAYYGISSPDCRKAIKDVVESCANSLPSRD